MTRASLKQKALIELAVFAAGPIFTPLPFSVACYRKWINKLKALGRMDFARGEQKREPQCEAGEEESETDFGTGWTI